jgi:hypothetical protein
VIVHWRLTSQKKKGEKETDIHTRFNYQPAAIFTNEYDQLQTDMSYFGFLFFFLSVFFPGLLSNVYAEK